MYVKHILIYRHLNKNICLFFKPVKLFLILYQMGKEHPFEFLLQKQNHLIFSSRKNINYLPFLTDTCIVNFQKKKVL